MDEGTAICGLCGSLMPSELWTEHLAEHGIGTKEELEDLIREATIEGLDTDFGDD